MDDLRIGPAQAAEKVDAGTAFLLDVVTEGSWQSLRQVPKGRLRIPPDEIHLRHDASNESLAPAEGG
jgi:hypothetical protein